MAAGSYRKKEPGMIRTGVLALVVSLAGAVLLLSSPATAGAQQIYRVQGTTPQYEAWVQAELVRIIQRRRWVPGHPGGSGPPGTLAGTGSGTHLAGLDTCGPGAGPNPGSYRRSGHTVLVAEAIGRGYPIRHPRMGVIRPYYMVRLWGRR